MNPTAQQALENLYSLVANLGKPGIQFDTSAEAHGQYRACYEIIKRALPEQKPTAVETDKAA